MDNSSNVYVRNSSINEIFTDFTDFGYARLGVFLTTDFTDFTDFGYASVRARIGCADALSGRSGSSVVLLKYT